jgi:hypothetical protein
MGVLVALIATQALAQSRSRTAPPADDPPPASTSRGENFSAKPPAQLFASDCTGAGCHRGPQGLAKGAGVFGLTSFLRQHYTNSQQSAAALAAYLNSIPGETRPARRQPEPRSRAAARPDADAAPKPDDDRKPVVVPRPPPRGRQATAEPPAAASPPVPPPAIEAAAPEPSPPKVFDIFD